MYLLQVVIVLALLATIAVLFSGLVSMGRGGAFDHAHSEQLMWGRIALQGLAVLLLITALILI